MSDVRDFGAVGDGINDDTEAILHALEQGDGFLHFHRGIYKITRTIEINLDGKGPYGIDGSGGTANIVMTAPGPAFRVIGTHKKPAHPEGVEDRVWNSQRMPMFKDIAITGTHAESDGIEIIQTFQPTFTGVHIRQCRHGIRIHKYNRNVLISHCHFYHNRGIGIFMEDCNLHQIIITGSHISYNREGGIRIEGSQIYNLQITGNDIEYNNNRTHGTSPTPTAEIYIDSTGPYAIVNEVTIASNTIQATPSEGGCNIRIIEDRKETNLRYPGLYAISGNVIGSQETNVHLTGCHGIVFSGNTIYSCVKLNVLVENSEQINFSGNTMRRHAPEFHTGVRFENSKNCVMTGCTVEDETMEGQSTGVSTLTLQNCERINITGSQILSGVPYCVDVKDSSYINIAGCTIADVRDKPVTKSAVRFSGKGKGNMISATILGPVAAGANTLDAEDRTSVKVSESVEVVQ